MIVTKSDDIVTKNECHVAATSALELGFLARLTNRILTRGTRQPIINRATGDVLRGNMLSARWDLVKAAKIWALMMNFDDDDEFWSL